MASLGIQKWATTIIRTHESFLMCVYIYMYLLIFLLRVASDKLQAQRSTMREVHLYNQ